MTAIGAACRSRTGQSNSVALSSKRKREETIVPDTELSMSDAELLRAFERQGHDALAATYHAFFAPVTAMAIAPLLAAVSLRPGTHLLDVATGPGALAAAAANRGAQAVGVDLSPRMIELARRLHPGIDFREAEVEHLPFADCTFDAVVCGFGLGHFPRPEAAVAECVRAVKPGGRIALSWWDDPARQRIQGIFRETIAELDVTLPPDLPQAHDSYRFSNTEEFLRLLSGTGLVEVAVAEHATSYSVPDVETLWRGGLGSCVLTGAAIRHQDEATQKRIRAAFERRASVYKSANGLDLPVAFKVGSGRKPI
jgi:ubiquinone/menaquinone biosynthesis C-methylase UbiE